VVRHVCQPDDLWLLCKGTDRPEAKLIGFLQEKIQLANLALDDIVHD
jgi:hypothetical protein